MKKKKLCKISIVKFAFLSPSHNCVKYFPTVIDYYYYVFIYPVLCSFLFLLFYFNIDTNFFSILMSSCIGLYYINDFGY